MKERNHLYVNRNHAALWLMVLLLTASVIARIAIFTQVDGVSVWQQIVWPGIFTLLFALIALISGHEMFHRIAVPVWGLGICYGWQLHGLMEKNLLPYVLLCLCILFFCAGFTSITAGNKKHWMLLLLYGIPLCITGYFHHRLVLQSLPMRSVFYVLPDYLLFLGMIVMQFSIKVHTDGKYHPTWKDRIDGRYIRTSPVLEQIVPFIMVNRTGANNLFEESVEITQLERYVRAKRRDGMPNFGMTHVIVAAYVRTVAKYPAINRFVAGQRIYSRGEDIAVCMTVKKEMTKESPDTVIKAHFHPGDTAADVYTKFNAKVVQAKDEMENSGVDDAAGILTSIPRLVLKFVVWLLRILDYFGLVPAFLLEVSPFHGSVYFTSMGSLGIRPVYHHLYDFGTVPAFCAFGRKRRSEEICNGEIVERKYMDLKFNLDERICDGFYYASVIKYFLRLLSHPELLDVPPDRIEADIA